MKRLKLIIIFLGLQAGIPLLSVEKTGLAGLGKTDTVPFLNNRWSENYFIGNGIVGGGGDENGNWNFLIGPDYTSPNFLKSEIISVTHNGETHKLSLPMHRIRATGIYLGTVAIKGTIIRVFEYAVPGKTIMMKHFVIENNTALPVSLQIIAEIEKGIGINDSLVGNKTAVLLKANPTSPLFGNGDGGYWKNIYSLISFNTKCSSIIKNERLTVASEIINIASGQNAQTSLVHYLFDDSEKSIDKNLKEIRALDLEKCFNETHTEWHSWINKGKLNLSSDARVNDIIESTLVGIRMQQNRCGGFIAGVRKYAFSYIRDSYGACIGLLSCGHTEEVKKYLEVTAHKFRVFKKIPNSVQMGADKFSHGDGNQYAEGPAYAVLLAKAYYEATHDLQFLKSIDNLLLHAIDVQIDHAKETNWLLPFNGDETEQYCVKEDGSEYGGFPALTGFDRNQWSMSAVAACIASIEFYIDYSMNLRKTGSVGNYTEACAKMKESLVKHFYSNEKNCLQWALKKDGSFYPYNVTNFVLMPLWFGITLDNGVEKSSALRMLEFVNPKNGFLANAPGDVEGFCGHTLGFLLYDLTMLNRPEKDAVFNTLINSCIIQRYGMLNEYYGPNGVPNPHNLRVFESGFVLHALVAYLQTTKH